MVAFDSASRTPMGEGGNLHKRATKTWNTGWKCNSGSGNTMAKFGSWCASHRKMKTKFEIKKQNSKQLNVSTAGHECQRFTLRPHGLTVLRG